MITRTQNLNHMFKELKDQYENRIEYLKDKIGAQQKEIDNLNEMISLLTIEKIYDC